MDKVTESQKISYTLGVYELPTSVLAGLREQPLTPLEEIEENLKTRTETLTTIGGQVKRMAGELQKMKREGNLLTGGIDTLARMDSQGILMHIECMTSELEPFSMESRLFKTNNKLKET